MLLIPLLLLSLSLPCWAQTNVSNFVFLADPLCPIPINESETAPTRRIFDALFNDINDRTDDSVTLFSLGGQLQSDDANTTGCAALYDAITTTQRTLSVSNTDYSTIPALEQSPPNYTALAAAYSSFPIPAGNTNYSTCGDYTLTANNGRLRIIVLASLNPEVRTAACNVAEYLQAQLQAADTNEEEVVIIGSDPPTLDPVACARQNANDMTCSRNGASAAMNAAYASVIGTFSNIILFQAFGGFSVPTFSYAVPLWMNVPLFLIPSVAEGRLGFGSGNASNAAHLRVTLDDSLESLLEMTIRYFATNSSGFIVENSGMDLNVTTRLGIPDLSLVSLRNATLRLYNNESISGQTQADIWNELVGAGNPTCDDCTLSNKTTRRQYACSMVYTVFDDWNACRNGTMPLTSSLLLPGIVLIRGTITIGDASDSSFDFTPFVGGGAQAEAAVNRLREDLASILNVSPWNIGIVSIRLGSIVVDFEVFFPDDESSVMSLEELNATAQTLQRLANNISSTSLPTLVGLIQATNSSFSPNVTVSDVEIDPQLLPLPPISPVDPVPNPGEEPEAPSESTGLSGGAIAGIVIGSAAGLILVLLVTIGAFVWVRRSKQRLPSRNAHEASPHQ